MYTPANKILDKYADVLINFALNHTKGIRRNDVVLLQYDWPALPLAIAVQKKIIEVGAHSIIRTSNYKFHQQLLKFGNKNQIQYFPKEYTKSLIDTIDHRLYIIADENPFYLKDVDPRKITLGQKNKEIIRKWMEEKEAKGKFSWTLALYGTEALAKEANLTEKEFWNQIKRACFLSEKNPVAKWQEVQKKIKKIEKKLTNLKTQTIHIVAKNTDLKITLGEKRRWLSGRGANIPSFEIFTSPDWRGTNGHIFFDYPLYHMGNIVKDIYLEFKNGKVIKAKAKKNERVLHALIKQKNADKIGEFSLTDKKFSKITKFMANTLYDENFGGKYGNTHLALGTSYNETFDGNIKKLTNRDLKRLGFNKSPEHADIIATTKRTVTVTLKNGKKLKIYKDGEFLI